MGIFEAEGVADLADGLVGCEEAVLGFFDEVVMDEVLGVHSDFLAEEVAEIVRGKVETVRESRCGQEAFVAVNIFTDNIFRLGDYGSIERLASYELATVVAHTVVQKELDVRDYQSRAVLVHIPGKFCRDFADYVIQGRAFLFGEMQGFGLVVGEEGIFLHPWGKGGAADEVGVEEERPTFRVARHSVRRRLEVNYLFWGYADEAAFLEVVWLTAPFQDVGAVALEHHDIEVTLDLDLWKVVGSEFSEVDDVHEGMKHLISEQVTQFGDGVKVYDIVVVHYQLFARSIILLYSFVGIRACIATMGLAIKPTR